MASIDSNSTEADIVALYNDNCGYEEDDSAAMAVRFVTACRAMLRRGIVAIGTGAGRMQFDPKVIREEMADAKQFAQAESGTAVRHVSLRELRT